MHLSGVKFGELNCSRLTGFEFNKATQSCKPTSEGLGLQITITQKKTRAENFLTRDVKRAWNALDDEGRKRPRQLSIRRTGAGRLWGTPWPSECFSVE
jgi:hypothetical protein